MSRRKVLEHMLAELAGTKLEVVLAPNSDGSGRIRVVQQANPGWYQKLCATHTRYRHHWRKLKTRINRRETLRALERMLRGDRSSIYAQRIQPLIPLVAEEWKREGRKYARR